MQTDNQTKTMLLVEDNDALRLRLAKSMERCGFQVTCVSSVAEGLRAIHNNAPNYAIVDLRLEDGSGLDVIEALEQQSPSTRSMILTGYGNIPTAVAAARLGAIDYIAKPASADEIIDTLMTPKGAQPPAPSNPITPDTARLEHIESVYHDAGENVSETARLLQMHRRTLQRILRRNTAAISVA